MCNIVIFVLCFCFLNVFCFEIRNIFFLFCKIVDDLCEIYGIDDFEDYVCSELVQQWEGLVYIFVLYYVFLIREKVFFKLMSKYNIDG